MDFDAAIVGAGTAGCVAAINLAPFRRVLVIEQCSTPTWRIGESLPGIAGRLLSDMGLFDAFNAGGHRPRHTLSSAADPVLRDAMADPDGHGWQIDRVNFEKQLRAEAILRGAVLKTPAKVCDVEPTDSGWIIRGTKGGGQFAISARILIDAAGRGSRCIAPQRARRSVDDHLSCVWLRAHGVTLPPGAVQIEAEAAGWWYAAPLPDGIGVLGFHTDSNLPEARAMREPGRLIDRARGLPMLGELVADGRWDRADSGYCAAHGASLNRVAGDGWLAVGDAAIAFDPIAGQGIFNAMYLGLSAAETVHRLLSGDAGAGSQYVAEVARIRSNYMARRAAWYGLERRWANAPFWRRRQVREP